MATLPENQEEKSVKTGKQSIPRRNNPGPCPLSFAQERLWFLNQLEPESLAYNQPKAIQLKGTLNTETLKKVLDAIVARHAVFRTSFHLTDGQPIQVVADKASIELPTIDLSGIPGDQREKELESRMVKITQRPFDLSRDSMLRAGLLRLGPTEHVLLLVTHHIASDGWSSRLLFQEIATLYEAFSSNLPSPLPELPIQYADFAVWQRNWLQGEVLQSQLAYWKHQLAGELPIFRLPTDYPRPAIQTDRGAAQIFALSTDLAESLKSLSRRNRVTLFMTLLAAFQTLLYRYTGQDDIIVGAPIANRPRVEVERVIGFFANTLVLRTDLSGNPSFQELLSRVREVALGAYAHQDLPFEKLVEEINPARDLTRNPLFQVIFNLQNPAKQEIQLSGLSLRLLPAHNESAKFDLSLSISDKEEGLTGTIEYNTDLFNAPTISRMCGCFRTLLQGIVANPEQRLSDLPILTEAERAQLLVEWNNTTQDYPKDKCIHELFEAQVERSPDAVAVVFDDKQLTYRELNLRANQLAHHLQKLGVGPDVLVGICMERSLEMVVGLLGILKAGGAYIPLDPSYPQERLDFMLQDAQTPVLLTQQRLMESLPRHSPKILCLDTDWEAISLQKETNLPTKGTADTLAYVIYTSGSTGKPKGVLITHYNVTRLLDATNSWFHFDQNDVWTLFHSYAFDFSVWELWGALLYGGRLVVVPYGVSRSPEIFYRLLSTERVTILNQTPSAFSQLIQVDQSLITPQELALRLVIFGGEALDFRSLKSWFDRHGDQSPQLVNMYGITETTVHVTYRPLNAADLSTHRGSFIGVRIPDLELYVLDQNQNLVPVGVPGELYVGGSGVGRGYLNRPELTAERFVPNPFDPVGGERLYRSGDLVRYLPNRDIEYLGRIDAQVKIRGFRIELGEIEAALSQHPAVRAAIVIAQQDKPESTRLVAYVVPNQQSVPVAIELRSFLKTKLPEYMVPSAFVFLDILPLTTNGKVDRRALPAPDQSRPDLKEAFVAPRTPAEKTIAKIWAEILKIEKVGIHDNFFDLGGHSLVAVRIISRVRQRFGIELPLRALFENPTVAGLATQVEQLQVNRNASEGMADVLADIESLSDEEAEHLLAQGNFKTSN
jgi:amino acid adenylation domain-containing protein